ncbi:MAG: hypothetical protein GY750_19635 [Lentisphaerae bacterium]|nr:hypothetical protein [Lentisphaerota bacterium]MCP4103610.1 hypothetical protein [Lentisphaerota bacterium]
MGVDVWRRAQNKKGGVGCWIEADSHPKIFNPAKDTQHYYLALPTRHSTMLYAAHAALLARAFLKCGALKKADLFKKSAIKAFKYAINPNNRIVHRLRHKLEGKSEYVTYTFREPPGLDIPILFKAAYNLAILTGDDHYRSYANNKNFEIALQQSDYPNTPFFMTEVYLGMRHFPDFAIATKKQIMDKSLEWLRYQEMQAYRTLTFPTTHVFFRNLAWGNAIPFNKGRYFIMAYSISGAYKYRDAALLLNDWLHGANPMGRSLPTGTGVNYPVRILSLPSYADGILEPMPGITPYTYTFQVDYNVKNMVYALRYPPRKDHNFAGADICLMPDSIAKGKNMNYRQISNVMDKFYPVWRRFGNIEQYAVEQNEFTVWETIGPCAACLGALIPPGWKPPADWKAPTPKESFKEMEGYMFQP